MRRRAIALLLAAAAATVCDFPSNRSTTKLGTPSPGSYTPRRFVIDPGGGAVFTEVGASVSASFFKEANQPPLIGRSILDEDISMSVAMLGHGLWEQRFSSDPAIVGKQITVDDRPMTVVGVMPASFTFPEGARIWTRR